MVKFLKEKTDLTRISSVLSLFTLVAFHWPFFRLGHAVVVYGQFRTLL